MQSSFASNRVLVVLLAAVTALVASCGGTPSTSGYGIEWVTVSSHGNPRGTGTLNTGSFSSYIVNIDSITLTRSDGVEVTALSTFETVDFAKLNNYAELWGSATIPVGRYVTAQIVLDYTAAVITVLVNGVPTLVPAANVLDSSGAVPTTVTITVNLDPNASYDPNVLATYATTSAERLSIAMDLYASNTVSLAGAAPAVTVNPYLTVALAPADSRPIRIRGPLINSNVAYNTFTNYVRPFYDEANNLGSVSMFVSPSTIFAINGTVATGSAGLTQLSQSSAGSTVTATFANLVPSPTPTAVAGDFNAIYVVAGSTLEDVYTYGLEGDVIARSGDTLTLEGATLFVNDGATCYLVSPSQVLLGANTLVTADGTTLTGLGSNDVAVGQHIVVRGRLDSLGTCLGNTGTTGTAGTTTVFDATGNTAQNTGSVRLIQTALYGSYVSAGAGELLMDLATIDIWPSSIYGFAGNGSASTPAPASFSLATGAIALPSFAAGDPVFASGLFPPFGAAPPDFTAATINNELSVQQAGQTAATLTATSSTANPTPQSCALGNMTCIPASMQVTWSGAGTSAPFATLTAAGATINLSNAALASAVIRIGSEVIEMSSLPASPTIVPTPVPPLLTASAGTSVSVTQTLPPVFMPAYSYGNPSGAASALTGSIYVASDFATFATNLPTAITSGTPAITTPAIAAVGPLPARQLEAQGTYDRATNTFTALSINVLL